jgi:outer membrane protein OmpA-like peptidoglycan-associated protein
MNKRIETGLLTAAIAMSTLLAGCATVPDRVEPLERARADINRLQQDPLADQIAMRELAAAREALQQADNAYADKQDIETIEHLAYLAQRHADISEQRIAEEHAKQTVAQGELERNRVLLQAREREAERLAEQNRAAQARNEEAEQRNLALATQAEELQRQAAEAEQRAKQLESELTDLQAKQTERGLVLTLGDVLFDTGQATLNPGAASTMDRLAQFMSDNAERQVMIEGHTDSRGDDAYNIDLSARRAMAVRNALLERSIDPMRIRTVGLGESYPVASNDNPAGMQQNRRVEIVISDEQGNFPQGAERTATAR